MEQVIYSTEIIKQGKETKEALAENLIVLFGKDVPEILEDIVFVHNNNKLKSEPQEGDWLEVDDNKYKILEVGDVVYENLSELGHCTLTFGENEDEEILPGSMYLEAKKAPDIGIGSQIKIIREGEMA